MCIIEVMHTNLSIPNLLDKHQFFFVFIYVHVQSHYRFEKNYVDFTKSHVPSIQSLFYTNLHNE